MARHRLTESLALQAAPNGISVFTISSGLVKTAMNADAFPADAPWTSPDGDDTATSASSSRGARRAISAAVRSIQASMRAHASVLAVPELPEMEIVARRLELREGMSAREAVARLVGLG